MAVIGTRRPQFKIHHYRVTDWINWKQKKLSETKQKNHRDESSHPYEKNTSNYAYIDQISHKNRPEFNI